MKSVITFSLLVLLAQYSLAEEQPCTFKKGVFSTTSGVEFKGFGAKNKCLTAERDELINKNCVSGSGAVIGLGLPNSEVKVECDSVDADNE